VIAADFVRQLNEQAGGFALPWHRASKKVPHLDLESSQRVEPDEPNAIKFEMFVFDALPLCETSVVYETDREEEFAPIKQADSFDEKGDPASIDCPAASLRRQNERAARWLEANRVAVPRDPRGLARATLEIRPTTAIYPGDLAGIELPTQVQPDGEHLI
jgi:UDP-N-acetylglucosamine/UDP-N-acetylgalactosamine diphosphorylase